MNKALYISYLMVSAFALSAGASDELFEKFSNPPAEAKPFVRWWWNGSRVVADEIRREIEIMQKAGIGGFEINTVSQPGNSQNIQGIPELEWLSPGWCEMVRVAASEARKRGMIADIIVGSGWPFGAEFLKPDQMLQKMESQAFDIDGPGKRSWPVLEFINKVQMVDDGYEWSNAPPRELLGVFMAPEEPASISECRDLTGSISKEGVLSVDIPDGKHKLHVTICQRGFIEVILGSPGACGPVLDHYKAEALELYLKRMSDALNPVFDGKMGNGIRAAFCDSIELSQANWTDDMVQEFSKRRGYDLRPWLPFVGQVSKKTYSDAGFNDVLNRVRYDYCRTLVELFRERFILPYHNWCHRNGVLSRFQAYGSPDLLGMLEGYLIADIPESNNWLYSHTDPYRHGYDVWTKYASSAGHLSGKRIVSTESMTNTRGVFKTTLGMIKQADDRNFIMGINHSVLHGFNYSPPEAGCPGWVRYGTYFSEHNTWWPYVRMWLDYNARISAVFQQSEPVVRVAVLAPRADSWSVYGLERIPYQTRPWYAQRLWEPISRCGATADYITETVLKEADFKDGCFIYGNVSYDALVLAGVQSLEVESAQALLKYAEAGGRIAFIEQRPKRSPGYKDAGENDSRVQNLIEKTVGNNKALVLEVQPGESGPDQFNAWAGDMLDKLKIQRSVTFRKPSAEIYQVHRRHRDRDVFFIINSSDRPQRLEAKLATANPHIWFWNPETGQRQMSATGASIDTILQPHESLLLVGQEEAGPVLKRSEPATDGTVVSGPWRAGFRPYKGEVFEQEKFDLCDLSHSKDRRLSAFAGTVVYTTGVRLDDAESFRWLDLGEVHGVSRLTVNGNEVGCRWYGRHIYEVGEILKKGENSISVEVTTTLYNHVATLKDPLPAREWARQEKKLEPVGLLGPVQLISGERDA